MGRPPKITPEIDTFIRGELIDNPSTAAQAIARKLDDLFPDEEGTSWKYAVARRVTQIREDTEGTDPPMLDQTKPWSVGDSPQYGIPLNEKMTAILLTIKMVMKHPLSIGEARWIALLYDLLHRKIEELYPISKANPSSEESQKNLLRQFAYHHEVASQYFRMERIAKAKNEPPDTTPLDLVWIVPKRLKPICFALGTLFVRTPKVLAEIIAKYEAELDRIQEGLLADKENIKRKEKNNA